MLDSAGVSHRKVEVKRKSIELSFDENDV
jgi:hypothetical protein